jgi:hypothetical protein
MRRMERARGGGLRTRTGPALSSNGQVFRPATLEHVAPGGLADSDWFARPHLVAGPARPLLLRDPCVDRIVGRADSAKQP